MPGTQGDIGIGIRVRATRQRLGWSREALAFHAGISWSAISQLEGGRRRNLRPSTLAGLAGALGVTVDYLVSGQAETSTMLEHRVLLYEGDAEFLRAAGPFLEGAAEDGEPALVVAGAAHLELLRERLGPAGRTVRFTGHPGWGAAPAEAVDGIRTFLGEQLSKGAAWARILVEPVADATPPPRVLGRYEALLNLVFAAAPLTALCAYDTGSLDPETIALARATHPHALAGTDVVANPDFIDTVQFAAGRTSASGEPRLAGTHAAKDR